MYKSDITDKEWWIYDIFANLGWILYGVGLYMEIAGGVFRRTDEGMWHLLFDIFELLAAVGIVVGLAELISERIHKLDRILPKIRLYRGFGCLMVASLVGTVVSLLHLIVTDMSVSKALMAGGGLLCFIFVRLLFVKYKKQEE